MRVTYGQAKAGINCRNIAEISARLMRFFDAVVSTNLDVMLVPKRGQLYQVGFANDPLRFYWLLQCKSRKDIFFITSFYFDNDCGQGVRFERVPFPTSY